MLLLTSVKDSGGKNKQGLTDNLGDAAEVSQHKVYNIYTNKQLNGAIRWGKIGKQVFLGLRKTRGC